MKLNWALQHLHHCSTNSPIFVYWISEKCQIQELPDNIGKLKLLFYINLSYTKIKSLPESICQLYNLQVVNVEGCPLERFPKMFSNLINLRLITEFMEISS